MACRCRNSVARSNSSAVGKITFKREKRIFQLSFLRWLQVVITQNFHLANRRCRRRIIQKPICQFRLLSRGDINNNVAVYKNHTRRPGNGLSLRISLCHSTGSLMSANTFILASFSSDFFKASRWLFWKESDKSCWRTLSIKRDASNSLSAGERLPALFN